MPWYKSGTVSVALNSNAVIGTGTAFIANSRVGDAFRGPDGGWYEVTNIASDTAMSVSPNYQGATNATGAYALAPMQGYVKDSADALRSLVNQYGAKMAALGTTGNYDILPVTKGGTGGADQAGARSGLGLGSVAIESIVPVIKGGTGANTAAGARTNIGALAKGNNVTTTDMVIFSSGNPPNIAGCTVNTFSALRIANDGNQYASTVIGMFRDGANVGCFFGLDSLDNQLKIGGGTMGAVARKIYHEGNTTRAADGTLKAI